MKFTFSPEIKKRLKAFSLEGIMFFWYRHYKLAFMLLFLLTLSLAVYQWYHSLHLYRWSEEQKKEYIEATFKETRFRETQFQTLVERLKQRNEEHVQGVPLKRNIFTGREIGNQ